MIRALLASVAIVAAFVLGHQTIGNGPHCPTEDSCSVSYGNGHWTVTPATP